MLSSNTKITYLYVKFILLMFILKWFSKKENRRGFLNNHFYKFYITFIVVFLGMTIVSIYSLQVRFVIAMTMNIILSEVYDMLRDVIQNDILIRDELTSYNQNRRFYKQTGGMIGFVLSLVIKEFGLVKDIEMYLILDFISFMICITPLPYWYEYWKKNTDK